MISCWLIKISLSNRDEREELRDKRGLHPKADRDPGPLTLSVSLNPYTHTHVRERHHASRSALTHLRVRLRDCPWLRLVSVRPPSSVQGPASSLETLQRLQSRLWWARSDPVQPRCALRNGVHSYTETPADGLTDMAATCSPNPRLSEPPPLSPLDITVQCSSRVRAPRRCETTTRPQPDPCTAGLLAQPQGGKPLAHPTSDTEREGEAGEALRAPQGERVV